MDGASSMAEENSVLSSHITNDVKNTAGCSLFMYHCLIHLKNLCDIHKKSFNVVRVSQNSLTLLNKATPYPSG